MIDIAVEADKIVKIAQLRKTELCLEDRGVSDMQSFVVFQTGDMFECVQSGVNGHPFESLPSVLNLAYNEGKHKFDTVSLVVDSYVRMKTDNIPKDYKPGDLQQEYKNNPNSSVVEALTVTTYGYHGGSAGKCVKYIYNDAGVPEFTTLSEEDSTLVSEFVDFVMKNYIEFCKKNSL